ncbi:MAG: hypothetical protein ACKVOI_18835 [Dongiaceae bacterium]
MANDIDKVLENAEKARGLLAMKNLEIQQQIDAIDDIEWDRPLNATEAKQRKEKRMAQSAIAAAKIELGFVTLRALNETSEVQRLTNAFRSINRDLKKDLDRLNEIGKAAERTARIVDALVDIATDIARLLAS